MTEEKTKVFLVEDDSSYICMMEEILNDFSGEIELRSEKTLSRALKEVAKWKPAAILLDLMLPDSKGLDTLSAVCANYPNIPVIVITSVSDKLLGISAIAEGAQDYLVKGRFGGLMLARTIKYAVERKRLLSEKEGLIAKLREALDRVKLLTGFLPVCARCKRIRGKDGRWVQMEEYISGHSEAEFTHCLCDDCVKKHYRKA